MSDQFDQMFSVMDKAAPEQPKDAYDAMFSAMDKAPSVVATQNLLNAQGTDPNKAAQALELSRQTGAPQPAIEANLPAYQQQAKMQSDVQALDTNPGLASYIANDPLAARLANDDFQKLGFIDKTLTALKTGMSSAMESNALGRYGFQKQTMTAMGVQSPEVDTKVAGLNADLQKTPTLTGGFGAVQSAAQFGTALLDNLLEGGSAGAAAGAGMGALAGGIGAAPGAAVGAGIGFKADMSMVAAGNAYLKMDGMRGSDGQPLSESGKQLGALFTGMATYALAGVGVSGAGTVAGETADKLVQAAVTRPTVIKALTDFGAESAKGIAGGAVLNLGMEASGIIGEQLAQAMSDGPFPTDPKEIADRLEHAAITGAITLGAMHTAMHGIGLYGDLRAAQDAGQNAQMLKNVMDGAQDSALRNRDQQAFQDFMQHQTDGTPVENLYVSADKVLELYQSAKIEPTADRAADPLFGFVKDMPEQLREAQATGGDVVIPTADYVTHLAGTPLSDTLLPDLRVGANAMSMNDAKAYNEQYQMRLQAATDVAAKTPENSPTQDIFNDIQKQTSDAGYSAAEAKRYAAVYASRYATRAERLGVDPMEAYKQSGISVVKGEMQSGDGVLNQDERGQIKLSDSKAVISLFKDKDTSTLIHETGHLWLNELSNDAKIDGAPEQLKTDMTTTLKWLGAESTESITPKQHEQFARAVEAYFMEGKAPSPALASVFSRFKTWLSKIYQSIKSLDTPINDDIRGVFDRMLATDSEIEAAKANQGLTPAFRTKEEAGMTSAEWKSYTGAIDKANRQTESQMLDKAMAKIRKERTKEYKAEMAGIKDKVAAQIDERPDMQALKLVTKGMLPDGTEVDGAKLSRADVQRLYGEKGVTDLPRGATSAEGMHPDAVAEMLGYQSGDALIKDLTALEQQQRAARLADGEKRGIRQILIDTEAQKQMEAKGDPLDEQSIQAEAMAAIHSEGQTELLATELRYLKRMNRQDLIERGQGRNAVKEAQAKADWDAAEADLMGRLKEAKTQAKIDELKQKLADLKMSNRWDAAERNTEQAALREATAVTKPMLDAVRARVDTLLESKTLEDIGNFNKYLRDERKAAREVQNAILKKDWNAAAEAKQRQILANILYVKAKAASDQVDKAQALMSRLASKPSFSTISQEYLNQIHDLISRFGFDSGRGEELQRTKGMTLDAFVQDQMNQHGIELAVDQSLMGAAGGNVDKMSLSDFNKLALAVRSMEAVGRSDKMIMVDGKQREFKEVRDELVDAIRALGDRNKSDYLNPKSAPLSERAKESAFSMFRSMDASLTKKESLFDQIDQNDPFGIANTAIFRKLKDAENNRSTWSEATAKDFKKAALAEKGWLKSLHDVLPDDATLRDQETGKPVKLARKDMIGMALNWGNEGNRERLADGYGWRQENIKAFLDRNMTKADWDFAQSIWKAYDRYKAPLDELQQRVTGIGLDMVHADAFETPHGTYEGGYYPIVEDASRSYRAESNKEKSDTEALFQNSFMRATTPHGNTISRIGGKRPISIDLDIAPWKVGQTIHDIAMREALIDSDRLLNDASVKKAMDEVFGPEYRKLMRPWLQNMANSRNIDDAAMGFWNRSIQTIKTNTTMVGIGFRAMTMFKHGATALSNSMAELGSKWMLAGTKELYGPGMQAKWEFIKEKSPEMAYRLRHYDQDVSGQYDNLFKDSAFTKFQQQAQFYGHIGISYLDLGSAAPTWLGAYRKGLSENMQDADAVYYANKTVRNAHGAQGMTDKSRFQEERGPLSLTGMFYGFFNHIYNRQRSMVVDAAHGIGNAKAGDYKQASKDFASVLAKSWYYVAVPAFIEALAQNGGPKQDQDETWAGWAAKAIMAEIPAGIPILRDIAKATIEGRNYEMSPVGRAVDTIVRAGTGIYHSIQDGEPQKNIGRTVAEGVGYAAGLPTAAPYTAAKFLWDYSDGSVDPRSLSDWVQGLLKGKVPEH